MFSLNILCTCQTVFTSTSTATTLGVDNNGIGASAKQCHITYSYRQEKNATCITHPNLCFSSFNC